MARCRHAAASSFSFTCHEFPVLCSDCARLLFARFLPSPSPLLCRLFGLLLPARVFGASAASNAWSEYARAGPPSHARVGQFCAAPPAKTGVAFAGTCCAPLACCLFPLSLLPPLRSFRLPFHFKARFNSAHGRVRVDCRFSSLRLTLRRSPAAVICSH